MVGVKLAPVTAAVMIIFLAMILSLKVERTVSSFMIKI
jgi:hypothetical protein